jgi:hypothetical protein
MFSNCFISCLLPCIGTAIFGDNSIIVASAVARPLFPSDLSNTELWDQRGYPARR